MHVCFLENRYQQYFNIVHSKNVKFSYCSITLIVSRADRPKVSKTTALSSFHMKASAFYSHNLFTLFFLAQNNQFEAYQFFSQKPTKL